MGEIIPSESLSQELMARNVRRQSSPIYEELERTEQERRARQKKIHEKDQWRITKMSPLNTWNQQNHQREKGLRTNPKLELSRSKQPWILLRTKPLKTGRPKNKPELKKLTSERIRALQTAQKTTPQEKNWVEDGSGKQRKKVTPRIEKGALHKRKQSY